MDARSPRPSVNPLLKQAGSVRSDLIGAATAVFARQGFRRSTLKDVATKAGLDVRDVEALFPSTAALLSATLVRADWDFENEVFPGGGRGGWQGLDGFVEILRGSANHPGHIELFEDATHEGVDPESPVRDWLVDHYELVLEIVTGSVVTGIARGEMVADTDPAFIAHGLSSFIDGLSLQWLARDRDFDLSAPMETFLDLLRLRYATPAYQERGTFYPA